MNRRQKKKWLKNHVKMTDRYTGRVQYVKIKDFIELAKIAELTKEDLIYLANRDN